MQRASNSKESFRHTTLPARLRRIALVCVFSRGSFQVGGRLPLIPSLNYAWTALLTAFSRFVLQRQSTLSGRLAYTMEHAPSTELTNTVVVEADRRPQASTSESSDSLAVLDSKLVSTEIHAVHTALDLPASRKDKGFLLLNWDKLLCLEMIARCDAGGVQSVIAGLFDASTP